MNSDSLALKEIRKTYGATVALDNVSLTVRSGEVHAILGENGAGKTTLIKVAAGVTKPDSGLIVVNGVTLDHGHLSPEWLIQRGVATVYQEGSLVPDLSVAQNLSLGHSLSPFVSMRIRKQMACKILEQYKLMDISCSDLIRNLTVSQRQMVEIARAASHNPSVLLLDEAFSALSGTALSWLFELLEELKGKKVGIAIVSHRLAEVKDVSDRITVLRNGQVVGSYPAQDTSNEDVVKLMLGRGLLAATSPVFNKIASGKPLFEVRNISVPPKLQPTSFTISKGEVVGVAALEGQGEAELFKALYGLQLNVQGRIFVEGKPIRVRSPRMAIRNGIAYIPNDRVGEGLCFDLTVSHNMTLPVLSSITRHGWLQRSVERILVLDMLKQLAVSPNDPYISVRTLSGGNQQKVLLGKWLLTNAKVFLLYDPTRGVDVGAKQEINIFIRKHSTKNCGVLYYSTDIEELVAFCDRILVFYKGSIVKELTRENISPECIVSAMTGIVER